MITSRKFKQSYDKMVNSLTEGMLPPSTLRENYTMCFGTNISSDQCKNIRELAIDHFKSSLNAEFNKMCEELQIEERLLERKNIIDDQINRVEGSGWRPTGDAFLDTYGDRRKTQLEHLKNLKALEAELEQKFKAAKISLEKEQNALEREIATLEKC